MREEPLAGGNANPGVARVGNTVRRGASPWSVTVHRLLRHQRAAGLDWVPAPHGFDSDGREVLDFIEGEVPDGTPEWLWSKEVLDDVAAALSRWHEASADFERRPNDRWWAAAMEPAEVICHGDFAPYNHVFREGRLVGVIDFDTCQPGPRLWDLAYTAYRYVPLTPPAAGQPAGWDSSPFAPSQQRDRLDRLIASYSGDDPEKRYPAGAVVAAAIRRLEALADWSESQQNARLHEHAAMYRAHARWLSTGAVGAPQGR